jgi:threonine dehydratase
VTEFIYRYNVSGDKAHVMLSFKVDALTRPTEVKEVLAALEALDMKGYDISDDELAKSHARYMIGGCHVVPDERIFRFGTSPVSDNGIKPEGLCQNFPNGLAPFDHF